MKVIAGKVVYGRVELPPGEIAEGATVAIVTADDSEPITLPGEQERDSLRPSRRSLAVSSSTAMSCWRD